MIEEALERARYRESVATRQRYRRMVPGSRRFDVTNPWILIATRKNAKRVPEIEARGGLVCPFDDDPATFEWPVRGLSVTVIGDSKHTDRSLALVQALLADGAKLVVVLYNDARATYHQSLT